MKSRITHVALYAKDLEKVKNFYVNYFDGSSNEKYVNGKGFSSYFITFAEGPRLEVMAHQELISREVMDKVNGLSHMAFALGSKEAVLELTQRLVDDGYELLSPPRITGDGYFESCVSDPEGNRVEICE